MVYYCYTHIAFLIIYHLKYHAAKEYVDHVSPNNFWPSNIRSSEKSGWCLILRERFQNTRLSKTGRGIARFQKQGLQTREEGAK